MSNAKKVTRKRREIERDSRLDLDSYEPVAMVSRTDAERGEDDVPMIEAFSVDGVSYFMPREVPFAVVVKSLDIAAHQGEAAAVAYQLETLLSPDGYRALFGFKDIDRDQFEQVADLAAAIIMANQGKKAR